MVESWSGNANFPPFLNKTKHFILILLNNHILNYLTICKVIYVEKNFYTIKISLGSLHVMTNLNQFFSIPQNFYVSLANFFPPYSLQLVFPSTLPALPHTPVNPEQILLISTLYTDLSRCLCSGPQCIRNLISLYFHILLSVLCSVLCSFPSHQHLHMHI